jgi:hypothetical protein
MSVCGKEGGQREDQEIADWTTKCRENQSGMIGGMCFEGRGGEAGLGGSLSG